MVIRADLRNRYGDHRFERRWQALMDSGHYQPQYGNLRELFQRTPDRGTRFVIHYCSAYELDVVHANWLAAEAEVELQPYAEGDHSLVRHMRDSGELGVLLQQLLAD